MYGIAYNNYIDLYYAASPRNISLRNSDAEKHALNVIIDESTFSDLSKIDLLKN